MGGEGPEAWILNLAIDDQRTGPRGLHPHVAIIVLTWNQRQLALDCLQSISLLDYRNRQTIVVDNASHDGTIEAIRDRYPYVAVIQNRSNLGFAEGNNVGIRWALREGADYVLLLNQDTVVEQQMLTALIDVAESDSQIGIVGPLIFYLDDPKVIWRAGNAIDWRTGELQGLYSDERGGYPSDPYEVDYVSGCALLIKRKVIQQIGLIDPRFFVYYDETDWCLQARAKGYKAVVVPKSRIWHKVSASIGTDSPATTYYMSRNAFLFLSKNLAGRQRLRALMATLMRELRTILAHSIKPRYRQLRANRNARVLALRDAIVGSWGIMGSDVASVCYHDQ